MSRQLRFTKTEMKNAAQVAVSEHVSVILKPDGSIEIVPSFTASQQETNSFTTLTDWLAANEH